MIKSSSLLGVHNSAAAVGVGALRSDTKSISVVSVSCPTADKTGILLANTALTTISSLNAQRSSMLPPPRATIIKSGTFNSLSFRELLNPFKASAIKCAASSPCTGTGQRITSHGNLSSSL